MKKYMSITALLAALLMSVSCKFITIDSSLFPEMEQLVGISDDGSGRAEGKIKGTGPVTTREYKLEQFSKIETSLPADIRYEYTDGEPSVSIRTNENIFEYLNVSAKKDVLSLKIKNARSYNIKELEILVKSPELNSISISGAVDFETDETLRGRNIEISVAGAGEISICGIEAESCMFGVAGAGEIDLGSCISENVKLAVAGAADMEINNMDCTDLYVSLAGAGSIDLNGKADKADLAIAGVGKIDIQELTVRELTQDIKGIGSVIR